MEGVLVKEVLFCVFSNQVFVWQSLYDKCAASSIMHSDHFDIKQNQKSGKCFLLRCLCIAVVDVAVEKIIVVFCMLL